MALAKKLKFPFLAYSLFVVFTGYLLLGVHAFWTLKWGLPGTTVFAYPIESAFSFMVIYGVSNYLGLQLGLFEDSDDDDSDAGD